jgi:hypothetical protein
LPITICNLIDNIQNQDFNIVKSLKLFCDNRMKQAFTNMQEVNDYIKIIKKEENDFCFLTFKGYIRIIELADPWKMFINPKWIPLTDDDLLACK